MGQGTAIQTGWTREVKVWAGRDTGIDLVERSVLLLLTVGTAFEQ